MNPIVRTLLLSAIVVIGLSVIPVAALTGSFLATHAVSAAVRKADLLTLAVAPKPDTGGFAVDTPIRTAAR
jgi:hypothetical protein